MTRQQHDFDMALAERVDVRDVARSLAATRVATADLERLIRSLPRESELRHALVRLKWQSPSSDA